MFKHGIKIIFKRDTQVTESDIFKDVNHTSLTESIVKADLPKEVEITITESKDAKKGFANYEIEAELNLVTYNGQSKSYTHRGSGQGDVQFDRKALIVLQEVCRLSPEILKLLSCFGKLAYDRNNDNQLLPYLSIFSCPRTNCDFSKVVDVLNLFNSMGYDDKLYTIQYPERVEFTDGNVWVK